MKNYLFIFYIILSVIFGMQAHAEIPVDEADPYFLLMGEADDAIKAEDYSTAVARLKEAISVDPLRPSNSLLWSNLGMVYSRMGQDSLAIAALTSALDISPNMTVVLSNRARLHLKAGHNSEAYDDFTRVLERDSLNIDARYYHGLMSLYGGKADVSEADFAVLKDVDPEGYGTQVAFGALYSMTGRDREAIPYYKKLITLDPSAEYYAALSGCYLAVGELSDASAIISEGLSKYDRDPELYYYRAMLNRDRYLLDDAKRDAALAIRYGAQPARVNALFSKTRPK